MQSHRSTSWRLGVRLRALLWLPLTLNVFGVRAALRFAFGRSLPDNPPAAPRAPDRSWRATFRRALLAVGVTVVMVPILGLITTGGVPWRLTARLALTCFCIDLLWFCADFLLTGLARVLRAWFRRGGVEGVSDG